MANDLNIDYSIDDLANSETLSVRSITVCKHQGLMKLSDIVAFYKINGTFINLKYAGTKANDELIRLCTGNAVSNVKLLQMAEHNSKSIEISDMLATLDDVTFVLMRDYFSNSFTHLPVRAQNVIAASIDRVDFDSYAAMFLNKNIRSLKLRNSGTLTNNEIDQLNRKLLDKIHDLGKDDAKPGDTFFSVISALSMKSITMDALLKYNDKFISKQFPLFEIFQKEYLPAVFKGSHLAVSKLLLNPQWQFNYKSELLLKLSITRERVRQIKNEVYPLMLNFFVFNTDIRDKIISHLGYLPVDSDFIDLLKVKGSAGMDYEMLPDKFFFEALSHLVGESYSAFDSEDKARVVLIKTQLVKSFNFNDLKKMLIKEKNKSRYEDELIKLDFFIKPFFNSGFTGSAMSIKNVSRYLIETMFGYCINQEEVIIFKRRGQRKSTKIMYAENWIKVERVKNNISRKDLAKAIGVSLVTISSVESGRRAATVHFATRVASYFNKRVEDIFFRTEADIPKR